MLIKIQNMQNWHKLTKNVCLLIFCMIKLNHIKGENLCY